MEGLLVLFVLLLLVSVALFIIAARRIRQLCDERDGAHAARDNYRHNYYIARGERDKAARERDDARRERDNAREQNAAMEDAYKSLTDLYETAVDSLTESERKRTSAEHDRDVFRERVVKTIETLDPCSIYRNPDGYMGSET
jgi:chromosome segregation ATPase